MSSEIAESLVTLENGLDRLSSTLDFFFLPASPGRFLPAVEVMSFLNVTSVESFNLICLSGLFEQGSELINTSPKGSAHPTFLVNVSAFQKRIRSTHLPMAS